MSYRLTAGVIGLISVIGLRALGPPAARAGQIAFDSAADAKYGSETDGAWKGENPTPDENPPGSDDGGLGFTPWNFAGGFHYAQSSPYGRLNHFIDGVDFPHSTFNSLNAPAFALTNANIAFGGSTARATRTFEAQLAVGDSVTIDFDSPALQPFNQFAPSGFIIRLNSGGGPVSQSGVHERFGFFTTSSFNNGNWSFGDFAGNTNSGLSSTQTTSGAKFRFTLTGSESYAVEISPLGGGAALSSRNGSLANAMMGAIDTIEILIFENGSGNGAPGAAGQPTGEREFFFNNLSVTKPGQAGDMDSDSDVDGTDFLEWQRGNLDPAALADWRSHYPLPASGAPAAKAVPEPYSIRLILLLSLSQPHLRLAVATCVCHARRRQDSPF